MEQASSSKLWRRLDSERRSLEKVVSCQKSGISHALHLVPQARLNTSLYSAPRTISKTVVRKVLCYRPQDLVFVLSAINPGRH